MQFGNFSCLVSADQQGTSSGMELTPVKRQW